MGEESVLVPIEEQRVDFYGDEIVAYLVFENNQYIVYVPLRPICLYLGLQWSAQRKRTNRDAILSAGVSIMDTPSAGGRQQTVCLRLDLLPGWLFGIDTRRVKPELKEKIDRYRGECFQVLWETFHSRVVSHDTALAPMPASVESDASLQELQRIAEMGRAMAHMAEQQMALQRQQQELTERVDKASLVVGNMRSQLKDVRLRLGVIEDKLHPHAYITEEQAAHVSTVVKALAEMLTRQEKGKNHYQGIFGELHRRFGVPSYKHIRQEQYADVLAFLDDWRDAAMGGRERQDEETGDA
jgi:hypothetical protein